MKATVEVGGVSYYIRDLSLVSQVHTPKDLMEISDFVVKWNSRVVVKNRETGWTGVIGTEEDYLCLLEKAGLLCEKDIEQCIRQRLRVLRILSNWR